jgi:Ca2+-binding EF-hand superfamily protein
MRTHGMAALVLLALLAPPLLADDLGEGKPAAKEQAVAAAEGKPRRTEPIDYLDYVFVASDRPVLLRLHLRNGNRPYSAAWDDYMQKLHSYLDKNGDGTLDKTETERAPDIQFLQFHLQGAIGLPYQGSKGQMAQFDTNKDGKVSLAEFREFYRRGNIAPLQLSSNSNRASTDMVTKTIYKRLDSNKDGKLSAEEMARAQVELRRFDLDENEMLTAMELTPGGEDNSGFIFGYSQGMSGPNADMGFLEIKPGAADGVSRQVLTKYDKDKNGKLSRKEVGLDEALFGKLDLNRDGQLDAKEFAGFFRRDSDLELIARVGNFAQKQGNVANFLRQIGMSNLPALRTEVFNPNKRAMPLADKVQRDGPSALGFALGDAHIGLSTADQQQFGQFPRQFFEQQFREADVGKKGVVDKKQAMASQFLSQIFDLVDRNVDGKVTDKELKAYLDMQSEGAGSRLELTITDEGRSLFDLLDEDGDSSLSLRELRSSWSRMKPLAKSDDGLGRSDITRRLDVSIGQAQRRFRRFVTTRSGVVVQKGGGGAAPLWFQKMDRNNDGDISPREFIGSDEDFRKLDADGDGLINSEEARQFEARLKKQNAKTALKRN